MATRRAGTPDPKSAPGHEQVQDHPSEPEPEPGPRPLVSVIVPVYNVALYLDECVESLLRQTYQHLEIIMIDDGSTDESGAMCDHYAASDQRVRTLHQVNAGLASARNAGLDRASGEYVTFVDSDDWVTEVYIEHLLQLATKFDAEITSCAYFRSQSEAGSPGRAGSIRCLSSRDALVALTSEYRNQLVIVTSKLYQRGLFESLRFPSGRLHEDQFLSFRLLDRAHRVVLSSDREYFYRQRSDSIMAAGFSVKGSLDAVAAFVEQSTYFSSRGMDSQAAWLYRRAFGKYLGVVANHGAQSNAQLSEGSISHLDDLERARKEMIAALRVTKHGVARGLYYRLCLHVGLIGRAVATARQVGRRAQRDTPPEV